MTEGNSLREEISQKASKHHKRRVVSAELDLAPFEAVLLKPVPLEEEVGVIGGVSDVMPFETNSI